MMENQKANGIDGIKCDINLWGRSVLIYLTNIFNNIFKKKQAPDSRHEAIVIISF